ncbi:MAG: SDR family NAD(P)-dependent oxidoreductase [Promethearchaeota archaeon]
MKTDFFENKVILVTGGAGSIGSELVKQLLKLNVKVVRVIDTDETELFFMEHSLDSDRLRVFIGDIRDSERMNLAMENVDIVFHAAALKHVPLCEKNPFEAVKTNIIGTQNLIQIARSNKVKKFITISTDKAINPTNVMGATKLLAERLTIAAYHYTDYRDTSFSSVRFGNVLGSRGSVIQVFIDQIQKGGPITVTDLNMTRFIMKIDHAVQLVLRVATLAKGGEIFILEMPALNLKDLTEVLIELTAPLYGYVPNDIKIKIIGNRIGEKEHEELLSEYETINSYLLKYENLYILTPKDPSYHPDVLLSYYKQMGASIKDIKQIQIKSSSEADLLSKSQIKSLLKEFISDLTSKKFII